MLLGGAAAGAPVALGAALVALGGGMITPCPYAAAADVLAGEESSPAPHRFAAVAAFATIVSVAVNIGGFVGGGAGAFMMQTSGSSVAHGVYASCALLAAIAAGVATSLGRAPRALAIATAHDAATGGPYRAPATRPELPARPVGSIVAGLAILATIAGVIALGGEAAQPPEALTSEHTWILPVGPLATFVMSTGVFALLLLWATRRWPMPPIVIVGTGLFVHGIGVLLAGLVPNALVAQVIGAVLMGLGSGATTAVPIAYAALAWRGRGAPLVLAGWLAAQRLVVVGANLVAGSGVHEALVGCAGVLALGVGVVIVLVGRHAHAVCFEEPDLV